MADSFDTAQARVPTSVEKLVVTLEVRDGAPNTYAGGYLFDVLDASGEPVDTRQGDLVPHLTTAQRDALKSFMDGLLTKAQGVVG